MVKQQQVELVSVRPAPPFWLARFAMSNPPTAGRFMLADFEGALNEPLFPTEVSEEGFTAAIPSGHPATRLLPGSAVPMLGPLGRGFRVDGVTKLLLIAENDRWPMLRPLLWAAPSVAVVLESASRLQLPAVAEFPLAVELIAVTRDGSQGYLGPLESDDPAPAGLERAAPRLRELIAWADCVCFACDSKRYPVIGRLVKQARYYTAPDFAQALVEAPMPCGVGACEICRISTQRGERHVCVDGPVFDLMDLVNGS